MHCPLCLDAPLEPKFVNGIEVDLCTRCRGIWLDRGELDRLLGDGPAATAPRDRATPRDRSEHRDRYDERDRYAERDRARDDRPKSKSRGKRLADLFEEVLDF